MSPTAITEQPATNGKAKAADPLLALDKVLPVLSRNPLKDRMHAGNFSPCYYIQMVSSPEVLNLAKLAGYHATVLNLEHHKTGIETASDICLAALNRGIAPICIVPSLQNDWISRLLDNGAQGIIVPRVGTADMAREMVRFGKHRPLGERPLAFSPQLQFQIPDFRQAQEAQNLTSIIAPMIETVEGLANVEEIAAVNGLDAIFVGVHDLSDDMGIGGEFSNPRIYEALSKICRAAAANGLYVGFGGLEWRPDLIGRLRKDFGSTVAFGIAGRDGVFLLNGMREVVKRFQDVEAGIEVPALA
ncbi:5-keto-4-deoxy-D-glucarate aldolase [Vanrija pseudolonga]|uniref:5-keto-4-deoxy-D-glucarate aldolase n=1 Tax=Vanrija pseudolonga TaxID=143232 RepID=A0AAF0XYT8_9TREE|nr:5-keto-4-deoxy-D-glucarate aldolase [Vanrija pseudolonga]